MRIIEHGNEIKKKCLNCKSILGISPSDLHYITSVTFVTKCPVCNINMIINNSEFTAKMREFWDNYFKEMNHERH